MESKITRHSKRSKKISKSMRNVDEETRKYVLQSRIDEIESDFYESPHRLAEEKSEDEYDFENEDKSAKKGAEGKPTKRKKVKKNRTKRDVFIKRNLNLKKLLKEEGVIDNDRPILTSFPNFINTRAEPGPNPPRKLCSLCSMRAPYKCPRCGERYCSPRCYETHSEVMCLKFDQ
eukprot:TRINITY_DN657_c0_g1_i1.p1 TRINITY_DN657_c0_g1~~TRINITY_DN657_c0_g1_i1.p1  ORF type:complete len:175 (+),score=21.06 TRINITY_DN657_c0_g1_i1:161-685(+)